MGHSVQPEMNQLLSISVKKLPQCLGFKQVRPLLQAVCVTTELTHIDTGISKPEHYVNFTKGGVLVIFDKCLFLWTNHCTNK